MKYAIDRYAIGTEKEVSADDFDGQYYIANRLSRFYCPECGEIVYFRAKGGRNPNHFFHQEKTDRTPECDKRVDGRSSLSLSERVGLPMYLTTLIKGSFQINIGFPGIDAEMLQKAVSSKCTVIISSDSNSRTVKVNNINFIENELSLIPVDFIPKYGRNYSISIKSEGMIYGLHRKWSDYADGFDQGGAVFTYEESTGKKVRRGDSISTNRRYYVVSKNALRPFSRVKQKYVGKLSVGQETFGVYIIEINVTIDESSSFAEINNYFKRSFGVWLLECPPELVPLWPPVVQHDCLIPILDYAQITCAISSGNADPNVYAYSDYGVLKKEIRHDYNGIKTVEIALSRKPVTLSVDRKYVGREVTFVSRRIPDSQFKYVTGIGRTKDGSGWGHIDRTVLSSEFSFYSNSKMELYTGSKGKMYRHISIRDQETLVPAIKNTEELYLVVESSVIQDVRIKKDNHTKIEEDWLLQQFHNISKTNTNMVPIPRWADYIIRLLRSSDNNDVNDLIISFIEDGKIPVGALRLLRIIELKYLEL